MTDLPYILVVDDDVDVRDVVRELLEGDDLRVSVAADGRQMRRVVAEERVDLVLLDAVLPGESGLSLARHATALGLRVILMTGDPTQQQILEASGFPFIMKPFRMTELLALVRLTLQPAGGLS
jgi:two-component system OmpR family response regulator